MSAQFPDVGIFPVNVHYFDTDVDLIFIRKAYCERILPLREWNSNCDLLEWRLEHETGCTSRLIRAA